jgi:Ca2+-transporting ATPase
MSEVTTAHDLDHSNAPALGAPFFIPFPTFFQSSNMPSVISKSMGLTALEAAARLKTAGYNELPSSRPKSVWRIAVEVVREPMFLLLVGCAVLYIILGDYREGMAMLSAVLLTIGMTFYQYQKTERALEALRNLSSPRVLVVRDGRETRIAGPEVVPGDVMILNEGDRIAADATLVECLNLSVDESLLTGESIPVVKTSEEGQSSVFSGTMVVQGKGLAVVDSTGPHTRFGRIGVLLKSIDQEQTHLQTEINALVRRLGIAGTVIILLVIAAFYFTRGDLLHSVLNGLTTAMALVPGEFPVILTIFLALGAWRLSKKQVLTRNPTAIETLGSTTVLCSDKTGTITQNKMEVAAVYEGSRVVRRGEFTTMDPTFLEVLRTGARASRLNSIDPMEHAIHNASHLHSAPDDQGVLVKEYPLSRGLLAMTRVTKSTLDQSLSVSAKGAPEAIFSLCHLTKEEEVKHLAMVHQLAEEGYRVIALATASPVEDLPEHQSGYRFKFLGLLGLEDPIRPEVPLAIDECLRAGVGVIMITGDFPTTAKSIARQIGLPVHQVITGKELEAMSEDELRVQIRKTNVFARIVPEQKLRIVQALKANGEIVAMTGDGVNDAPALKASHIGVAMGNKGTDVAREASSLVLLDDNFTSIVGAIRSGRRIFDNLQKSISYIIAIHIPTIGITLLPALIPSLPILLMPLHVVFLELIIGPICASAFESEQDEKGIMNRPPRSPDQPFFGFRSMAYSTFTGLLLLCIVLSVYLLSLNEGHSEGEVRAIAYSTLILGNIFLILTVISKTRNFLSIISERNYAAIVILVVAFLILIALISIPGLRELFSFEFPGFGHFIPAIVASTGMLAILEGIKFLRLKKMASVRPSTQ